MIIFIKIKYVEFVVALSVGNILIKRGRKIFEKIPNKSKKG